MSKVMRSKVKVPNERSLHEVSTCEISEPYPLWFWRYTPSVKFLKSRSKSEVKVTRSKVMVQNERSHHKESMYEIRKPYPLWFKRYSQG